MSKTYFDDGDKITFPQADRIVAEYIAEKGGQRDRVTSSAVLDWAEVQDSAHNQKRVHSALDRVCERTETDWAGRTAFAIPEP